MFKKNNDEPICRYFNTPCKKHGCVHYIDMAVTEKDGTARTQFECADLWQLKLAMENAELQRQTGAAIESFRNAVLLPRSQPAGNGRTKEISN